MEVSSPLRGLVLPPFEGGPVRLEHAAVKNVVDTLFTVSVSTRHAVATTNKRSPMKYLGPPQSGSMAGTTASHNRAGQYLRNRRTPVTPTRTPRQSTIRGQFGAASSAYQGLTQAQQNAWIAFASSYPYVDALGQSITLTGQQMYVAVNMNLQNAGQSLVQTPPVDMTVNPVTPVIIYADVTGTFLVMYTAASAGDFVLGAYSALLSAGVQFNKTFTQGAVDSTSAGFMDLSAPFLAQWGAMTLGRKVFARVQPVNEDGLSTPGVIVQTVVQTVPSGTAPTSATSTGGNTVYTFTGGSGQTLILQSAPHNTGPWTTVLVENGPNSPATVATPGATTYYRAAIYNAGVLSNWSAAQVGS